MIARMIQIPAVKLSAPARGVALMLLSVALFSTNCLIVKYLGERGDVSFWAVNFYRGVAGTVMAVFLAGAGMRQVLRVFYRPLLVIRGVLGASGLAMFYLTVFHLDLGTASVINLTYVLWGSLFAALFLGEMLGLRQVAGLALAFAGVPMLCGFSLEGVGIYHLVAIGGAITAGLIVMLIRLLVRTESSTTIYASQAIYGIVVAAPFLTLADLAPAVIPLGLMLGSGCLVAAGQLLMTLAYENLPVARGASIQLLLPVLNALGAFAFFGERYTAVAVAGGALVLAGSFWVVRAKAKG